MRICEVCGKEITGDVKGRRKYHRECAVVAKKQQMKIINQRHKSKCRPSVQNCLNCQCPDCNGSSRNVTKAESEIVHNLLDGKTRNFMTVNDLVYDRRTVSPAVRR